MDTVRNMDDVFFWSATYCVYPKGDKSARIRLFSGEEFVFQPILKWGGSETCNQTQPPSGSTVNQILFKEQRPEGNSLTMLDYPFNLFPIAESWTTGAGVELQTPDTLPYDPETFEFTHRNGTVYRFENGDVVHIQDRNGNQLNFANGMVTHSSGKQIKVTRDTSGRVTEIFAPSELNGTDATLIYHYDGSRLAAVDRLVDKQAKRYETTTYLYTSGATPLLREWRGPGGPLLVNDYDENGILVGTRDAEGNRTKIAKNPDANLARPAVSKGKQVITDPLGNATTHEYNANGDVVYTQDGSGRKFYKDYNDKHFVTKEWHTQETATADNTTEYAPENGVHGGLVISMLNTGTGLYSTVSRRLQFSRLAERFLRDKDAVAGR